MMKCSMMRGMSFSTGSQHSAYPNCVARPPLLSQQFTVGASNKEKIGKYVSDELILLTQSRHDMLVNEGSKTESDCTWTRIGTAQNEFVRHTADHDPWCKTRYASELVGPLDVGQPGSRSCLLHGRITTVSWTRQGRPSRKDQINIQGDCWTAGMRRSAVSRSSGITWSRL
jgi:hypothetical protein